MRAFMSLVRAWSAGMGAFVAVTAAFCLALTVAISGPPTDEETAGFEAASLTLMHHVQSVSRKLYADACREFDVREAQLCPQQSASSAPLPSSPAQKRRRNGAKPSSRRRWKRCPPRPQRRADRAGDKSSSWAMPSLGTVVAPTAPLRRRAQADPVRRHAAAPSRPHRRAGARERPAARAAARRPPVHIAAPTAARPTRLDAHDPIDLETVTDRLATPNEPELDDAAPTELPSADYSDPETNPADADPPYADDEAKPDPDWKPPG